MPSFPYSPRPAVSGSCILEVEEHNMKHRHPCRTLPKHSPLTSLQEVAEIKEEQGKIDEAAEIMQEVVDMQSTTIQQMTPPPKLDRASKRAGKQAVCGARKGLFGKRKRDYEE